MHLGVADLSWFLQKEEPDHSVQERGYLLVPLTPKVIVINPAVLGVQAIYLQVH